MARHSKWHNIKHRKAAADAKKGKVFTRHAKLIAIAARSGGPDPEMNPLLRAAIDNAKAANLPNDNIERAIKKGAGEGKNGANYEAIDYDAFGPGGVAILIQVLTDNRNRALTNIKNILNKNGGRFVDSGSVSWMFRKKGVIEVMEGKLPPDEMELQLIDAGAENVEVMEGGWRVITAYEDLALVKQNLSKAGVEIVSAEIVKIADNVIELADDAKEAEELLNLVDLLEEDDDVDQVFTNLL